MEFQHWVWLAWLILESLVPLQLSVTARDCPRGWTIIMDKAVLGLWEMLEGVSCHLSQATFCIGCRNNVVVVG